MNSQNLEELRELIKQGLVRFMTIDTSIFRSLGFALDHGLLGQLSQFKYDRFNLVLSEIVVREIRRQISDGLAEDLKGWPKIARRLLQIDCTADDAEALGHALADVSPEAFAWSEMDDFLLATGAQVVSADHAKLDEVLDLYFDRLPPFGDGGKRHEFPDAIALLGIAAWCKAGKSGLIVVSKDNDWKRFWESSDLDNVFMIDDLGTALNIVSSTTADRERRGQERETLFLQRLAVGELAVEAQHQLRNLLLEHAKARGSSLIPYQGIIERIEVGSVAFSNPTRIRDDDVALVVLVDLVVPCKFWASFNFYNSDSTRIVGNSSYEFSQDVVALALFASGGTDVSVEVVLNKEKFVIDFGGIEPDELNATSHS